VKKFLAQIRNQPWALSFIGALLIWIIIIFIRAKGASATLTMTLNFSVFYIIVGIGQMLVITLGPGNIDLSIPSAMILGGVVAMKVMNEVASNIPVGILYTFLTGVAIGLFNYCIIFLLRIPPIIVTLSSNLIIQSIAISYGRGLRIYPPDSFAEFTVMRILGIPIIAIVTIFFSILIAILLSRSVYGRSIISIGQNNKAARLVGIKVHRIKMITYTISATLAAIAGALLAGFSGGTSLDLGSEYLLAPIAVVVLGGTSIAGGKSNVPGIWGASMFLYLLVAMINTLGIGEGLRLAIIGIIIVAVISFSSSEKS